MRKVQGYPKTPAPYVSRAWLESLKNQNYIGANGQEYDATEVEELIIIKKIRETEQLDRKLASVDASMRRSYKKINSWKKLIEKYRSKIKREKSRWKWKE